MKIKNLYLKIVSKIHEPTKNEILYRKQLKVSEVCNKIYLKLLEDNNINPEEITEQKRIELTKDIPKLAEKEVATMEEEIIKELRRPSYTLIKLNNIPTLDIFVRQIFDSITPENNLVIIPNHLYVDLLKNCNFPSDLEKIHIWLDSNVMFCTIRCTTKEELDEALAKNYISVEKYDEFIKNL